MKDCYCIKRFSMCLFVCLLFLLGSMPVSAYEPASELPIIERWVNGGAQASDGRYLHDTWAVDATGISEYKYVLINQESAEVFRVKNYPEDIDNAKTVNTPTYIATFILNVPEDTTDEITVTFKANEVIYILDFNESNAYKCSMAFYPGEYTVAEFVPANPSKNNYQLMDYIVFSVNDKDVQYVLEVIEEQPVLNETTLNDLDEEDESEVENLNPIDHIKGFDKNGDLFGDTFKLIIAIVILFVVYALIKRYRKKKEELYR